jgi:hypothetical protein
MVNTALTGAHHHHHTHRPLDKGGTRYTSDFMTGWVEWLSPSIPQSWRRGARPFSLSVLIYLLRLAWWIFRVQCPVDGGTLGGREDQILEFWALIFFFKLLLTLYFW